MDNFAAILELVLKIFGGALSVLATGIAWKLLGKVGIQKTAERESLLRGYVKEGINRTEAWANENGKKGNDKLVHCLEVVKTLAGAAGLKKWADDVLVSKIEAQLTHNAANGSGVGSVSTGE